MNQNPLLFCNKSNCFA